MRGNKKRRRVSVVSTSIGEIGLIGIVIGVVLSASGFMHAEMLTAQNTHPTGVVMRDDAGDGEFVSTWFINTATHSLAFDSGGKLYGGTNGFIRSYDGLTAALIGTVYTDSTKDFSGLYVAPNGDLLASVDAGINGGAGAGVYRINPTTGEVIATIGVGTFITPNKIVGSLDGNVLVSDQGNTSSTIYKINLTTNAVSVFASDPLLNQPSGMDYGPDGKLYVANTQGDHGIYRLDPSTGAVLNLFTTTNLHSTFDLLFVSGNRLWVGGNTDVGTPSNLSSYDATSGAYLGQAPKLSDAVYDLVPYTVPEPTTLSLLAIGGLNLLSWRRIERTRHR